MKTFLDTDIIFDILAQREPFYNHSVKLIEFIQNKQITAFTSPIIIANLNYLLTKYTNKETAKSSIKIIRKYLHILPVDELTIDAALNSSFNDFEDAIEYYTAIKHNMDVLITRNIRDYRLAEIPVYTAQEFSQKYFTNL